MAHTIGNYKIRDALKPIMKIMPTELYLSFLLIFVSFLGYPLFLCIPTLCGSKSWHVLLHLGVSEAETSSSI